MFTLYLSFYIDGLFSSIEHIRACITTIRKKTTYINIGIQMHEAMKKKYLKQNKKQLEQINFITDVHISLFVCLL